ncbi:MAG: hypothetical protein ACJAR9_001793 [Celeribacter sp.]|jgi:hypothetical protein
MKIEYIRPVYFPEHATRSGKFEVYDQAALLSDPAPKRA